MFVALAATWGSSFLLIKIGLEGLTPEQVVWGRLVIGAAALLAISAATRTPLPRDPRLWGHLLVVALLLCVVPFSLFAWAEQHVSSGVASVLNATTPLMTMLVSLVALKQERLSRERITGLLLGFVGVLIVVGVGTYPQVENCSVNLPASAQRPATGSRSSTCGVSSPAAIFRL